VASSDDFADEVLTLVVEAGGSWWFGVLDAAPPDDLSTFSLIADIPTVELPRDSSTWVVAGRAATPADPIPLDTSSLTGDVVPLAWCLFDDEAATVPRLSGRLADIKLVPDSDVSVPAQTVNIPYPATVAATL
jgi:hypothetical protein